MAVLSFSIALFAAQLLFATSDSRGKYHGGKTPLSSIQHLVDMYRVRRLAFSAQGYSMKSGDFGSRDGFVSLAVVLRESKWDC